MACFADISVLQGSVATYYARCAEIFDRIMVTSLLYKDMNIEHKNDT